MWKFLSELPAELSFTIIITGIISIVIIALKGHLKAWFGKKTIEIGKDGADIKPSNGVPVNPPATVTVVKRTCGDCILMLMSEREKLEMQVRQESTKVLKNQMNFAEQKLLEIHTLFMNCLSDSINKNADKHSDSLDGTIQYKLFYGLLKDCMVSIKDEIRRSFKENGFYDLDNDSPEYTSYIKDRIITIYAIFSQYIRNVFPDKHGMLHQDEILRALEGESVTLNKIFTSIYSYAKEVRYESDSKISEIKEGFKEWVDDFIKPIKETVCS